VKVLPDQGEILPFGRLDYGVRKEMIAIINETPRLDARAG
jgi:hypothetical protein